VAATCSHGVGIEENRQAARPSGGVAGSRRRIASFIMVRALEARHDHSRKSSQKIKSQGVYASPSSSGFQQDVRHRGRGACASAGPVAIDRSARDHRVDLEEDSPRGLRSSRCGGGSRRAPPLRMARPFLRMTIRSQSASMYSSRLRPRPRSPHPHHGFSMRDVAQLSLALWVEPDHGLVLARSNRRPAPGPRRPIKSFWRIPLERGRPPSVSRLVGQIQPLEQAARPSQARRRRLCSCARPNTRLLPHGQHLVHLGGFSGISAI